MQEGSTIDTKNDMTCLAIESGGSGTRLALAGPDETILHEAHCRSASPLYRDANGFQAEFAGTLDRVLQAEGVIPEAIAVVGLAGPADRASIHAALKHRLPRVPRIEHSEGELGLARYDLQEGIALVAGTGASCHAIDHQGTRSAIGGYGPQFGDEGSAYWIGREGLRAAFRAEQKRGEETKLLEAARDFYHIESPWQLLDEAQAGGHIAAPRVAEFAAAVDGVAADWDKTARAILEEAGTHLGNLVIDMAARTDFDVEPIPLVFTGGVFHAKRVLSAIEATLSRSPYLFAYHPVVLEPISGLIRLLQRDITIRNT